jgi:hypothetical protein
MNTGPTFWLIIATGAAVLLGVGLAYRLSLRVVAVHRGANRAEGNGGKTARETHDHLPRMPALFAGRC